MSLRKSLLAVGLAHVPSIASDQEKQTVGDPQQLKKVIMAEARKVDEAGFDIDVVMVKPEDSEAALKQVKDKLRSKKWDGYVVGWGVRGNVQYTLLFEQLVNAGIEIIPGTKMGFNTRPDDLYECVVRNF